MPDTADSRRESLLEWLTRGAGLAVDRIEPASGDASFRRYFRVYAGAAQYIAMDAPPDRELSEPFVRVAGMLGDMGLNAPRVLAHNLADGFLLLSDLGRRQYLDELRAAPGRASLLYGDAIAALLVLQRRGAACQSELPPYDVAQLMRELALFRDWLCGRHLELEFSAADEAGWRLTCDILVEASLAQPRVFVHRDYHSRNLMVCEDANPGILDFQDAMEGPLTYDLVSLLKDCYIRWPADMVRERALSFHAARRAELPAAFDEVSFLRAFELTGVQRHLKAAGIFARLKHRDGKNAYLGDVPRTLGYVLEVAPRHPELEFVAALVAERCLPALGSAA